MLLVGGCAGRGSGSISACPSTSACSVPAEAELVTVPWAERPDIEYRDLEELTGQPLEIAEAQSVRLLGWQDLVALVRRADGRSRLLSNTSPPSQPADCFANTSSVPQCLLDALAWQAEREAQTTIARAGEAYLGLQECYLQNELLLAAREGSGRRQRILDKFKANGLTLDVDSRELERQALNLDRQFARLAKEYQSATIGLELLLHLSHQPTVPLWPTNSSFPGSVPAELPACLELAFEHRPDRQALLALKSCLDSISPEQLTPLITSLSPWSHLTLPLPPALCIGQRRSTWERQVREQLHLQLCELLHENEKQITLEVNLAFARRWTANEQLRISIETVTSLQSSLDDVEALRAIEAVNIQNFLELEQRLAAAQSERVGAVLEQAKSELELATAIGVLDAKD